MCLLLAADGLVFKSTRGRGPHRHFVLNTKTAEVEFVEPEDYARRHRMLGQWEEILA